MCRAYSARPRKQANNVFSVLLPVLIPHYCLGKGLYNLGQNRLNANRKEYDAATQTLVPIGWDRQKCPGNPSHLGRPNLSKLIRTKIGRWGLQTMRTELEDRSNFQPYWHTDPVTWRALCTGPYDLV